MDIAVKQHSNLAVAALAMGSTPPALPRTVECCIDRDIASRSTAVAGHTAVVAVRTVVAVVAAAVVVAVAAVVTACGGRKKSESSRAKIEVSTQTAGSAQGQTTRR